jgi:hypothetical protein
MVSGNEISLMLDVFDSFRLDRQVLAVLHQLLELQSPFHHFPHRRFEQLVKLLVF